jgi:hypothetical protein
MAEKILPLELLKNYVLISHNSFKAGAVLEKYKNIL